MSHDPATAPPRAEAFETCAWCPKLCRHVCPVAVGTAREAAAPSNMALQPLRFLRGEASLELALEAASLCVECGACTRHCAVEQPLGELLGRFVRGLSAPPPAQPLGALEGEGRYVAVLTGDRSWAEALARHLGEPVAVLRTEDQLGAAHLAHPLADGALARQLQRTLGDRTLVVVDHDCLEAAQRAGLKVVHLSSLVPVPGAGPVFHPCRGPRLEGDAVPMALACCGARAPFSEVHPDSARDLALALARRLADGAAGAPLRSPDCRCAEALRSAGLAVQDPIDALLATAP